MSRHPAKVENSPRLQRVDKLLDGGGEYSTLEIQQQANVCAVNSCIDELCDNGRDIKCRRISKDVWVYWKEQEAA